MGAVLAEQHDEWTEGRRYLGLDVLARCRLRPVSDDTTEERTIRHSAPEPTRRLRGSRHTTPAGLTFHAIFAWDLQRTLQTLAEQYRDLSTFCAIGVPSSPSEALPLPRPGICSSSEWSFDSQNETRAKTGNRAAQGDGLRD